MSRKNAKICRIQDLQCKYSDVILTKYDCDMITRALNSEYVNNKNRESKIFKEAVNLAEMFHRLTKI